MPAAVGRRAVTAARNAEGNPAGLPVGTLLRSALLSFLPGWASLSRPVEPQGRGTSPRALQFHSHLQKSTPNGLKLTYIQNALWSCCVWLLKTPELGFLFNFLQHEEVAEESLLQRERVLGNSACGHWNYSWGLCWGDYGSCHKFVWQYLNCFTTIILILYCLYDFEWLFKILLRFSTSTAL